MEVNENKQRTNSYKIRYTDTCTCRMLDDSAKNVSIKFHVKPCMFLLIQSYDRLECLEISLQEIPHKTLVELPV